MRLVSALRNQFGGHAFTTDRRHPGRRDLHPQMSDRHRHAPHPAQAAPARRRSLPPVLSKAPPVAMVIFGASGDLTARKILPALARLADRGVLDDGFTVIGVARTEWSDERVPRPRGRGHPRAAGPKWRALTERFKYIAGEYDHPDTFDQL